MQIYPNFSNGLATWENLCWAISIVQLWVAKEHYFLTYQQALANYLNWSSQDPAAHELKT